MRRAHNDKGIIKDDEGNIAAIVLGFDFCAEHEFGIEGINRVFGIDKPNARLKSRRITQVPDNLFFVKKRDCAYITFLAHIPFTERENEHFEPLISNSVTWSVKKEKREKNKEFLETAWGDDSFQIVVGAAHKKALEEFYKQMLNKNVLIYINGGGDGNPFSRGGLTIAVADKIDKEHYAKSEEQYKENMRLEKAAKKTGIIKKIDKWWQKKSNSYWRKPYLALNPKFWKDDDGNEVVKFWLNPCDQRKYKAGWYTPEELEQWMRGEGPVIKPEKTSKI